MPQHMFSFQYRQVGTLGELLIFAYLGFLSGFFISFQNMAMVASIYMTVVIALERYIAVSRPIRAYVADGDQEGMIKSWLNVLKYAGPVILFSVIIHISLFFEFFVHCDKMFELVYSNQTSRPMVPIYVETSKCHICPHLRLKENYIKYYNNLFREGRH